MEPKQEQATSNRGSGSKNDPNHINSIISVNMHCIYNKVDDIKCLIKKYKPKV